MSGFAPRIHVLLARDSPLAVVIRRGPSKSVATLLWDRHTDTFTVGQWFKGRIYERRSDLSPDGKYFLYFAMNGHWESETKGSWTAISIAPYLKALVLLGKGDCWHGGGLWTGNRTYWLNDGYGHQSLRSYSSVQRDEQYQPSHYFGGECQGVYFPRLIRDGWTLGESESLEKHNHLTRLEKPIGHGWRLCKHAHAQIYSGEGKGCYWDEHELIHRASGTVVAQPSWSWAELDRERNRVVWAADGKLHAAEITRAGLGEATTLHDFSGMAFERLHAPY